MNRKDQRLSRWINPMLFTSIFWFISFLYLVIKEVIPPLEEVGFGEGIFLLFMMLFNMIFFMSYMGFFICKKEEKFFFWLGGWSLGRWLN